MMTNMKPSPPFSVYCCTCGMNMLAYGPEMYPQTKWAFPSEKSWKAQTLLADFHCGALRSQSSPDGRKKPACFRTDRVAPIS